ncbi:hypothetical protein C5F59_038105 [Streptomyces sp. QL37]|uniref:hypothetical protein n=1 Tax=Streptomyces sp. QL37 TaxID=2093747 RepID=UPI000CF269B2|nr:hypothetical protein [Streptomyces sp. QL37]PPQ61927.1 hypothetical protein C5F59_38615 [Streptomyces sp. QL37]
MNVCRTFSVAAAGCFLLAAAPSAQADNFAPALADTVLTTSTAGERTGTAAQGVAERTGVTKKVPAVLGLVQEGADAVAARDGGSRQTR